MESMIFFLSSLETVHATVQYRYSVAYRVGGVFKPPPPPEIPKILVESSISQARRTGVSISFYSSLCSHRL